MPIMTKRHFFSCLDTKNNAENDRGYPHNKRMQVIYKNNLISFLAKSNIRAPLI